MKKTLLWLLAGLLIALLSLAIAWQVGLYRVDGMQIGTKAIVGAKLLDGSDGTMIEDATVLIRDGVIEGSGPRESVPIPEGTREIKGQGLTLLPGLIDAHIHLGGPVADGPEDWERLNIPALIWSALRQAPQARRAFIEHGVTTVASLGDGDEWITGVRAALDARRLEGPRLLAAGPLFTAPGGHPAGTIFAGLDRVAESGTRQLSDPDKARQAVAEVDALGVDFIKAVVDGGDIREEPIPRIEAAVLNAIVDEAHDRGLKVTAHWVTRKDLEIALDAGVDSLQHAGVERLDMDLVDRIVGSDTALVPTLSVADALMPEYKDAARANVRRVHEAGGRIIAGSDAASPGVGFGDGLLRELELLVEAGLSPGQAIQAATAHSAEHLEIDDQAGSIEAGMPADLLAVAGDPKEDISAIRNTVLVLREGRLLVDRSEE